MTLPDDPVAPDTDEQGPLHAIPGQRYELHAVGGKVQSTWEVIVPEVEWYVTGPVVVMRCLTAKPDALHKPGDIDAWHRLQVEDPGAFTPLPTEVTAPLPTDPTA